MGRRSSWKKYVQSLKEKIGGSNSLVNMIADRNTDRILSPDTILSSSWLLSKDQTVYIKWWHWLNTKYIHLYFILRVQTLSVISWSSKAAQNLWLREKRNPIKYVEKKWQPLFSCKKWVLSLRLLNDCFKRNYISREVSMFEVLKTERPCVCVCVGIIYFRNVSCRWAV